jgi:predicted ribosomally synthesized peptide with nif11-like leader
MSIDNVRAFLEQIGKDTALEAKVRRLDARDDAQVSQIVQIAAQAGYPFSAQEWMTAGKQIAEALQAKYWGVGETELSDEELSAMAGGGTASKMCVTGHLPNC